jgi:hypothetical protein
MKASTARITTSTTTPATAAATTLRPRPVPGGDGSEVVGVVDASGAGAAGGVPSGRDRRASAGGEDRVPGGGLLVDGGGDVAGGGGAGVPAVGCGLPQLGQYAEPSATSLPQWGQLAAKAAGT